MTGQPVIPWFGFVSPNFLNVILKSPLAFSPTVYGNKPCICQTANQLLPHSIYFTSVLLLYPNNIFFRGK